MSYIVSILYLMKQEIVNVFGEPEEDPGMQLFIHATIPLVFTDKRSHQKKFNCLCKHPVNKTLGAKQ